MWNKIIGAAIIIALIFAAIFAVKFVPVYLGVSELERNFSECIGNYDQYRDKGCRDLFASTIEKNNLSIMPEEININAAVQQESTVEADWTETIDFFGVYTYVYDIHLEHTGRVPDRD